jgi:Sel1 repeat
VRCNQCNNDNPAENKFCGQCGARLTSVVSVATGREVPSLDTPVFRSFQEEVKSQETALKAMHENREKERPSPISKPAAPAAEVVSHGVNDSLAMLEDDDSGAPISGPSFLGLDEKPPASDPKLAYLYDEEEPARPRRRIMVLLVIAVAALAVYLVVQHPNWRGRIVENAGHVWARLRPSVPVKTAPETATAGLAAQTQTTSEPVNATIPAGPAPQGAQSTAPVQSSTPAEGSLPAQPVSPQSSSPLVPQPAADSKKPGHGTEPVAGTENVASVSGAVEQSTTKPDPTASAEKSAEAKPAKKRREAVAAAPNANPPGTALLKRADAYLYGKGVEKDCGQALEYLRTAADAGNVTARGKLGGLYATGNCVPLNRAAAYRWFMLARASGDRSPWIEENLSMLLREMTPEERAAVTPGSK